MQDCYESQYNILDSQDKIFLKYPCPIWIKSNELLRSGTELLLSPCDSVRLLFQSSVQSSLRSNAQTGMHLVGGRPVPYVNTRHLFFPVLRLEVLLWSLQGLTETEWVPGPSRHRRMSEDASWGISRPEISCGCCCFEYNVTRPVFYVESQLREKYQEKMNK